MPVDERVLFSANTLFSPLEGVNEPGAHTRFSRAELVSMNKRAIKSGVRLVKLV